MALDAKAPDLPPDVSVWLARARAGSDKALGDCLEACRNYLLLIANEQMPSDVRPKVAASDVVQETFLEAKRDFSHFAGATEEELIRWLRRILVNNLADATRQFHDGAKRRVAREVSLDDRQDHDGEPERLADSGRSPSSMAIGAETERELAEAMRRLSPDHARVIELRSLRRETLVTIGQKMDRTANAARKLWSRAIRALTAELESSDES